MVKLYYAKITNLYDEKCFEEKIKQVKEKRQVRIFEYCQKKDRCRSLAASLLLKGLLYFINEKVSADMRDKIWLVAQNAQIHWIVGCRMGADCMVSEKTKIVLELIYKGGTKDDGL